MAVSLIRGFIAYAVLVASVRLMGKRQIGELQPADLVITILISQIAAIPIEDSGEPLLSSVSNIIFLVAIEVFVSFISLKSSNFRKLLQGNSVMIIEDGKINEKALGQIRLTIDDLTEALREKDIFDITEVAYAYVETNGAISAEIFPENKPTTVKDAKIKVEDNGIPVTIISDGKVLKENFTYTFLNAKKLGEVLKSRGVDKKEVLILTADKKKICTFVLKGEKK